MNTSANAATGKRELVYQAPPKTVHVDLFGEGYLVPGELHVVEYYLPFEPPEAADDLPYPRAESSKTETRHRVRIMQRVFVDGQPTELGYWVCDTVVDIAVRH